MGSTTLPFELANSEGKKEKDAATNEVIPPGEEPQQLPQPPALEGAPPEANIANPPAAAPKPDQKYGEPPPDTRLEFLREQTVLLKPCEWQMDVGLSYLVYDHYFTGIAPPGVLVDERLRQRLLLLPLEVRYGWSDRVQLFANMPFGWANTEISDVGEAYFKNNGGIGDTNAGATILLHKSQGPSCSPDVLLTLGFTAPTGNGNALENLFLSPELTLGQGFWAGYWSLLVIHKYDPVVVFYGVGSKHYFERDLDQFTGAKPGDQYMYELGTGFAINERITLSATFFGYYITDVRLNDEELPGTILEPMSLHFATTITRPNKHICEPFVEVGLTDDAANARVGITWTF